MQGMENQVVGNNYVYRQYYECCSWFRISRYIYEGSCWESKSTSTSIACTIAPAHLDAQLNNSLEQLVPGSSKSHNAGELTFNATLSRTCGGCFGCSCCNILTYFYQTVLNEQIISNSYIPKTCCPCFQEYSVQNRQGMALGMIKSENNCICCSCCAYTSVKNPVFQDLYHIEPQCGSCCGKSWVVRNVATGETSEITKTSQCCGPFLLDVNMPQRSSNEDRILILSSLPYL